MTGMFTWRYAVGGEAEAARSAVRAALEAQGFRIDEASPEQWHATEGEKPTFAAKFLGAAQFPLVLDVRFSMAETGAGSIVELHRPVLAGTGGLTRNINEMTALDHGYRAAAEGVREGLSAAGLLIDSSR